jgi:TonB dependent receptor
VNMLDYKLNQAAWQDAENQLVTDVEAGGDTKSTNAFLQYRYRVNERLTASAGLHAFVLFLNDKVSIEPRASLQYRVNTKGNITFGYGRHSQMQPLGVYFAKNAEISEYNRNLGFSKAHHFVLGYDQMLNKNTRFKTEVYYQALSQIPVQSDSATSFSLANILFDFPTVPMSNSGLGRNYGLELTLERFLSSGFYYLMTTSLYDSKYRASDGVWRNTQFNLGYVNSLVAGKEWGWNRKNKNRTFSANLKLTHMGGLREAPLDLEASRQKGESVYDLNQAFSVQLPAYFRLDTGVRIKRNYKNITTTFALDVQNVTNRKNVFSRYYDPYADEVKSFYQLPRLPIFSYKLEF